MIPRTFSVTIAPKVTINGSIARFSESESLSFQSLDADRISDAQSRTMRHRTAPMLISETPTVVNILTADVVMADVVLMADMVLMAEVVLSIDVNMLSFSPPNPSRVTPIGICLQMCGSIGRYKKVFDLHI
jgi:hypothetical protein